MGILECYLPISEFLASSEGLSPRHDTLNSVHILPAFPFALAWVCHVALLVFSLCRIAL